MSQGQLYEANSAAAQPIKWMIIGGELVVYLQEHNQLRLSRQQVSTSSWVPGTSRELVLEDGRLLVCEEDETLHTWLEDQQSDKISRMETSRGWIFASIVTIPLMVIATFGFILPGLAIAFSDHIPFSVKRIASQQTLISMDYTILNPSKLNEQEQQQYLSEFERVIDTLDTSHPEFNVQIRSSKRMGPNAFALPDGTIVFTDQLIALMDGDQALLNSILLHEIGHVEENHSMRLIAESLVSTLAISYFLGDLSGPLEALLGTGGAIAQNQFSQQHERAADNFALAQLQRLGRDPAEFAEAMEKLSQRTGEESNKTNWLSSHPMMQERIDNARNYPKR